MKYTFADILNSSIYDNTRVMLIVGKYNIFNNIVGDELKARSKNDDFINMRSLGLADEFGIDMEDESVTSTSVDLDTFFDVVNVSNINGKWFCRYSIESLNKKQKEQVLNYIKRPSKNGILVLIGTEFIKYREFLNNKSLLNGQYSHLMYLGYPNKKVLTELVEMMFNSVGLSVAKDAIDHFILRVNHEYDEYTELIEEIKDKAETSSIDLAKMKSLMAKVENFDVIDFMYELVKPLSSGKVNNKKIIRMLAYLEEKYEEEELVSILLRNFTEMIEYRTLINKGYVAINIKYIYNDVLKLLGEDSKFQKVNEWEFRRKAALASLTSIRDWTYMRLLMYTALDTGFQGSIERKVACKRMLYALVNRSVFSESRINNLVSLDNILTKDIESLDKIVMKKG